jgi:hypothetical protein
MAADADAELAQAKNKFDSSKQKFYTKLLGLVLD